MKLVQITAAREVKIPGVRVEFVTEDKSIKEVILHVEGEENSYSFRHGPSYAEHLKVFRRVDYEMVERFRLSGKVLNVSVQEDFATLKEAENVEGRLTAQAGPDSVELKITPVMVRVDADGNPAPAVTDNEIPF